MQMHRALYMINCLPAAAAAIATTFIVLSHSSADVGKISPPETSCVAALKLDNTSIAIGDSFSFTVDVYNITSQRISVLDPSLITFLPIPGVKLLIFDSEGICRGDLLELTHGRLAHGSRGSLLLDRYWVSLPPSGKTAAKYRCRAVRTLDGKDLEPGKYRLQFVFLDTFISKSPYSGLPPVERVRDPYRDPVYAGRLRKWIEEHSGEELFRSNSVEIILIAPSKSQRLDN